MLQDIYPYIFNNGFEISRPKDEDFLVSVKNRRILLRTDANGSIVFPTAADLPAPSKDCFYLFSVSGRKFYALPVQEEELRTDDTLPAEDPESALLARGFSYQEQAAAARMAPRHLGFAAALAAELCDWYQKNRFCGRCGGPLQPDGKERMLRCPECGNLVYPRINPVIIAAVTDGNKLLLTKYKGRTDAARCALVAGFTEIGESAEDTVRREVFEETGVRVQNVRFYKSQPWPQSGSLLLGFVCTADSSQPIVLQEDELGYAAWVPREEITQKDDGISLTSEMIRAFVENRL